MINLRCLTRLIHYSYTFSLSSYIDFSGCNEIDYASECKAHGAGVSVSRTGECSLDDGNDLTKAEDASMAPTPTELPTDEDTNPVSAPSGAAASSTLRQCPSVVAIIVTLVLVGGQL